MRMPLSQMDDLPKECAVVYSPEWFCINGR